ncbi:MAG: glutamate synthase, partial [Desulfobulbaceae bacterium]|nr:glutamate synthase [Desulfobulbaceae bacterium]
MCRLALKTASEPFSPFTVLQAMEAMQEGYDGSGLGLLLQGLQFAEYSYKGDDPVLSGIAHTEGAFHRLNAFMQSRGFQIQYDHEFDVDLSRIEFRDRYKYILRVYRKPVAWEVLSRLQIENEMMM